MIFLLTNSHVNHVRLIVSVIILSPAIAVKMYSQPVCVYCNGKDQVLYCTWLMDDDCFILLSSLSLLLYLFGLY